MALRGQPKIFETPEELYEVFKAYKKWAKENPYKFHDYVGKDATEVHKDRERPITWSGFEGYLSANDIASHLGNYEQNVNEAYTDFLPTITRIKKECRADVIDGSLAGVFNQNVASRLEGLTDKKEVEKTVKKLDFKDAE